MRALVFAAVILSSSSVHADGALKVKVVPPKKGEVADVVSRVTSELHGTINGTKLAHSMEIDESWTQEDLAVDQDVVTEARVSFSAAHQKTTGSAPVDTDLPISKQTYLATATGGKVVFTDAKGGKVGAIVRAYLATAIDDVGQPDKTIPLFSGKEFTKGVAVTLSSAEMTSLLGATDPRPASSVTLTLVENDGKRARFALAGTVDSDPYGTHVIATITGTTTIDLARGRVVEGDVGVETKTTLTEGRHTTDVYSKVAVHRSATYR